MKTNLLIKWALIFTLLTTLAQSSSPYCEDGWSLEIRKGKDICYKYDKFSDKRFEAKTHAPKDNNKWKLIIDNKGHRDSWQRVK